MASPSEARYCVRHPKRETYVRCGRCGDPVCPQCMVHTDVGVRCPNCVSYVRNPVYQLAVPMLGKAVAVGLGLGLLGGVTWGLIGTIFPFFFFRFLIAIGIGSAIGSLVSLSANRKRGPALQVIAGGSVLLSFALAGLINPFLNPLNLWSLAALAVAVISAVVTLR